MLKHYLHNIIRHKGWCAYTFRIIDDLIYYTTRSKKWLTFEIPLPLSALWLLTREKASVEHPQQDTGEENAKEPMT